MENKNNFIPLHGNYQELLSYQKAAVIYDLITNYKDYLRVRDFAMWDKDSKEALFVRNLGKKPHTTYEAYREICETRPADVVANIAICLIHQANYLLDKQLRRLEQDFLKEGGLRERMTRARLKVRDQQKKNGRGKV